MTKKLRGSTRIRSRMRGNYMCKSLANSGENNKSNNFQHTIRVLYEYRYVHIYSYKIDLSRVKRIKLQWTRTQMSRQHTRTKQTTLHEQNTCKYTHLHVPLLDLPAHRSQRNARATQRETHLAHSTPAESQPSPLHSPNTA